MKNFDRQYRLAAGKAGSTGFEIGSGKRPLHVSFSVEKADTNSQNTAKVTIWNLSDEHLAELNKNDCVVVLHAGYGDTRPLIFTGVVTFATTKADGADRSTEIELVDISVEAGFTFPWRYGVVGNLADTNVQETMRMLKDNCAYFKILGNYRSDMGRER